MIDLTITVHEIAVDGLPALDKDGDLAGHLYGRVAFIHQGSLYLGAPLITLGRGADRPWRALGAGAPAGLFFDVERWIELPVRPDLMNGSPPPPRFRMGFAEPPAATVLRDGVPLPH